MNICAKWRGMKIFLSVVMETRVLHVSPSISLLWKRNMQETFKWRLVKSWTSAFIRDAISCNCWQSDDGRSAILIALHAQVSLNILHKNRTEKKWTWKMPSLKGTRIYWLVTRFISDLLQRIFPAQNTNPWNIRQNQTFIPNPSTLMAVWGTPWTMIISIK